MITVSRCRCCMYKNPTVCIEIEESRRKAACSLAAKKAAEVQEHMNMIEAVEPLDEVSAAWEIFDD